jgi:hypothetical protein
MPPSRRLDVTNVRSGAGPASRSGPEDPASQPAGPPGGRPAKAQLAAGTVTKQADGTVDVVLRELRNPAPIQRRLRADGVPAAVNLGGNPACQEYPPRATPPPRQIFGLHQGTSAHVTTIHIHPSALPSGAGVEISATVNDGPGHELGYVIMHLVRASRRCTGS